MNIKRFLLAMGILVLTVVAGFVALGGNSLPLKAHAAKPSAKPTSSPTSTGVTPTSTSTTGTGQGTATANGPVSQTWYFAEGRVGAHFREYLTMENPSATACPVSIQYLYVMDGSTTPANKTVTQSIGATSRKTESVNVDLGLSDTAAAAANVSAIVTATSPCTGVVVERPMYFTNYHGLSSGTDALGVTHLATAFNFADLPSGGGATSYLTILNAGNQTANITATYYANGQKVASQSATAAAMSRTTLTPGTLSLPTHTAVVLTSSQPVAVERPAYFTNVNGVSGAADVVGATATNMDWFFAEGFASTTSQEHLSIANIGSTKNATVNIILKSSTGMTKTFNTTVNANTQLIWNVNTNNTFSGATPEVSAEVQSTGAGIVVQREMYFQYQHALPSNTVNANCITDVMGLPATGVKNAYSFAEGYTNVGYHAWLTLQNPTNTAETIMFTVLNAMGTPTTQNISVGANSRATVDITAIVANSGGGTAVPANSISVAVQTTSAAAKFIAERAEYFNTKGVSLFPVQGGTDIIGYNGG